MDGSEFRMTVRWFFAAVGAAGSFMASAAAQAAGLLAQAMPSGLEQTSKMLPMLLFICCGIGATLAAFVAVGKIAWSLYTSAKLAVSAIAKEAITAAIASEREKNGHELHALREEMSRMRGELGMMRRFVMKDAGATPPPVEPRG